MKDDLKIQSPKINNKRKCTNGQRTDAFKLWCWRTSLRIPWTARRSKQSILKEINPKYSLEGLMLKLEFHFPGHLMQRAYSLEKTLMLWKIEDKKKWQQKMKWLGSIPNPIDINLSKLHEIAEDRGVWQAADHGVTNWHDLVTTKTEKIYFKLTWFSYVRAMPAQSSLTLCDPMDGSPPGSSVHGIFPAKNTGVGCHFLC